MHTALRYFSYSSALAYALTNFMEFVAAHRFFRRIWMTITEQFDCCLSLVHVRIHQSSLQSCTCRSSSGHSLEARHWGTFSGCELRSKQQQVQLCRTIQKPHWSRSLCVAQHHHRRRWRFSCLNHFFFRGERRDVSISYTYCWCSSPNFK